MNRMKNGMVILKTNVLSSHSRTCSFICSCREDSALLTPGLEDVPRDVRVGEGDDKNTIKDRQLDIVKLYVNLIKKYPL